MKSFDEIKKEYESKNYTLSEIRKSIFFFSIIRLLFTELFIFIISMIPFLIGYYVITSIYGFSTIVTLFYLIVHVLFYIFYVKGEYQKNVLPTLVECDMIIEALREIKRKKS